MLTRSDVGYVVVVVRVDGAADTVAGMPLSLTCLVFGVVGAGDATTLPPFVLMQQQNDASIGTLADQVGRLKELSIDIGGEVEEQNRMLDGMVIIADPHNR